MPVELVMPRLSDTMTEGTVARWLKKPGDPVKRGEPIAEIETDKATMPMEAFEDGTLGPIDVPEGQTVPLGSKIGLLYRAGEAPAGGAAPPAQSAAAAPARSGAPPAAAGGDASPQASDGAPPSTPAAPPSTPATPPPASPTAPRPGGTPGAAAPPAPAGGASGADAAPTPTGGASNTAPAGRTPPPAPPADAGSPPSAEGRHRASPLARRIAAEHDLDLSRVNGTGPGGRIVRADVEELLAARLAASAPTAPSAGPAGPAAPAALAAGEFKPFSRMQSVVARRTVESKTQV